MAIAASIAAASDFCCFETPNKLSFSFEFDVDDDTSDVGTRCLDIPGKHVKSRGKHRVGCTSSVKETRFSTATSISLIFAVRDLSMASFELMSTTLLLLIFLQYKQKGYTKSETT
ncbi:hypothetical protein N9S30_00500 [bacterium]|nr:hypothetical protein [bacterium]